MKSLIRPHISGLKPYLSARHLNAPEEAVLLDANESPFTTAYNRYPDPFCTTLKQKLSKLKGVKPEQIFLGNGSDQAIDLLCTAYGEPGQDCVWQFTPTYGMYEVSASIHNLNIKSISLDADFHVDISKTKAVYDSQPPKLIFINSPNNPTGNLLNPEAIRILLEYCAQSLVVVDEAYIDFSPGNSLLPLIDQFPNLVILQTFSKAWGLAGLRLGVAYAGEETIEILSRVAPPYPVSTPAQSQVIQSLKNENAVTKAVHKVIEQRKWLRQQLESLPPVERIFPSDANFLLAKFTDTHEVFNYLKNNGVIVRDQSHKVANCLRITVGTPKENRKLVQLLKQSPK